MVEYYPDDETEIRIADVKIPGVYHVKEQGGGYTSEYIAQHIRQRATAAYTPSGGGGGGGGDGPGSSGAPSRGDIGGGREITRGEPTGDGYSLLRASGTESFNLGDGDVMRDMLIDVSSGGLTITTNGDGWGIINIGVRGTNSSRAEPIVVRGDGLIENVYLGDGGGSGTTGIFVHASHSGHIDIHNANTQGWGDNGIYGSAPGNGGDHSVSGGGGTVTITDSYSANNAISNFRLGTSGSTVENSVSVGGQHRSYWGYYEDTELIDCHLSGPQIVAGERRYSKGRNASVTLTNCNFNTPLNTAGSSTITGESQGAPSTSPPDGCPTSPSEAAGGD